MMYIHTSQQNQVTEDQMKIEIHTHTQQRFHEVSTMNEGRQRDEAHT